MNSFVLFSAKKRILKKNRLFGCLILIALVMAPLVCALIFSESMMAGITNKYIYLSDGHLQIKQKSEEYTLNDFNKESLNNMAYSIDEVTTGYALMYSSTATSSIILKGIDSNYFNEERLKQITFEKSETQLEKTNIQAIAISNSISKSLDVKIGDRVALMIVPDNADKVLRPILVRIEAIFSTGYDQLDQMISFIDISYAKSLYSDIQSTSIEILANTEYQERLEDLEANLTSYRVTRWSDYNASVYENFVTSKQMIFIILMLVAFVAAFYSASVAQQMIQDDINAIAITKLIGASDKQVREAAMLSVYTVTFIGMILGIILGLLIGNNLGPILSFLSSLGLESLKFYLLDFETTIPVFSIFLISLSLLIVSFISIQLTLRKTKSISAMRLFTSS